MAKIFRQENIIPGGPPRYGFTCPGCQFDHFVTTGDPPGPSWTVTTDDLDRPTIAPSILVRWEYAGKKMQCHSFVRAGNIEFLDDCTHHLAGKTVVLPDV